MSKTVNIYVKRQIRLDLLSFKQRQMYDLGNAALGSIKERVARAYGPNDAPAPPLKSESWKRIKKHFGGRPIRDLEGNGMMLQSTIRHYRDKRSKGKFKINLQYVGHLMDQLSVRKVSDNQAFIVEPTTVAGRIKARGNREMLGFSPRNCAVIYQAATKILGELTKKMVKAVMGKAA